VAAALGRCEGGTFVSGVSESDLLSLIY